MIRATFVCGLIATVGIFTASAEDYPLTFRAIPAQEVIDFPGGYGATAQLRLAKPGKLRNEPRAVSRRPIYGENRAPSGGPSLLMRLDESKGDGKGYDQLIVDMNENGDLTDDAPAPLIPLATERTASSAASRRKLFGPIAAAAGKTIAGGRPLYFAQGYINDLSSLLRAGRNEQNVYAGYVRLKAGWYAEATVELNGQKQKVGVLDGNCNLHLGDVSKHQINRSSGEEKTWYFGTADSLLIDADGSGAFEGDPFGTEACAFGPVLYLGATPCRVALAADCKRLQVAPWTTSLAEVALQPHGEQVHSVTLAWEQPGGQWQLIRAGAADGKIKVPPGNYRLYGCNVLGKGAPRDQVMVSAYQRGVKSPLYFAAGEANTLRCGGPLEIKVTARKRTPESYELALATRGLQRTPSASDSEYVLAINANVRGADGEVYSTYAKGERFKSDPPKPTFTVMDASGKKVANGNLEFG